MHNFSVYHFFKLVILGGGRVCLLKKCLPFPRSQRYSPTFSSVSFMVVNFMFRSMHQIEESKVRWQLRFMFFHIDSQLFWQYLLKIPLFLLNFTGDFFSKSF